MRASIATLAGLLLASSLEAAEPANPRIDMRRHLQVAREAAEHRESRRVTAADFLRMSTEPSDSRARASRILPRTKLGRSLSGSSNTATSAVRVRVRAVSASRRALASSSPPTAM